jgi:hypothetical protein
MHYEAYTPFSRPFDELTSGDLEVLKSISDGWYVEYKVQLPDRDSIAKSISAFANTFGGWLFYGIGEDSSGEHRAGTFPGVDARDIATIDQRIQQAAPSKVNPRPRFTVRACDGPAPAIGLATGRSVIVVYVPQGIDTPYLHSNRRIYMRVGSASEPTHLADRHTLDLLVARSAKYKTDFTRLVSEQPRVPERQETMSSLKALFFLDPWSQRQPSRALTLNEFAKVRRTLIPKPGGFPSTTFSHTEKG